jgi:hypothetical protein
MQLPDSIGRPRRNKQRTTPATRETVHIFDDRHHNMELQAAGSVRTHETAGIAYPAQPALPQGSGSTSAGSPAIGLKAKSKQLKACPHPPLNAIQ